MSLNLTVKEVCAIIKLCEDLKKTPMLRVTATRKKDLGTVHQYMPVFMKKDVMYYDCTNPNVLGPLLECFGDIVKEFITDC